MGDTRERKFSKIGTRPIRHDGLDKVTGRAKFGADLELPGLIHGAFRRSPHAHANIRSIDTSRAETAPGVMAIVTAADIPAIPDVSIEGGEQAMNVRDIASNILARDKVLYHGHAVAAVAAQTIEEARAACELIDIEYEVLEPVLSIDAAIAPDAPLLDANRRQRGDSPNIEGPTNVASRNTLSRGDVEKGFGEAEVIVEGSFETPMVHQGYIEPHACVVTAREDEKTDIWCSTQGAFAVKELTAEILQCDANDLKVIPSEIGGGFGGKTTIYLEPVAAILSRKAGRPVKMVMTREEVFRASGPMGATRIYGKLGARKDGTITVAELRLEFEAGAFPGSAVTAACMTAIAPYKTQIFFIEGLDIVVNKPKVAAYRAPGAPCGAFAVESLVDELARKLDRDPIDLRLQNAVEEGDKAPYGPRFGPVGLRATLEAVKAHPHYAAPLGEHQGRGVASGFWFNVGGQSSATVSLDKDGSAIVRTGNPDIGGSRASLAMMAAEELGIPIDRVRPLVGDTDSVGYCETTGGSRVTYATGMAVIEAARQIVEHLRARAATMWDVELDAVEWRDGYAVGLNGASNEKPLSLANIAAKMHQTGGPIIASGSVNPPSAGPGFGVHLCDLEVDPETGCTRIVRYTVCQDAGKAIHPTYVEGQFQGGAAQGIGWALNEEFLFDESGRLENPGFLDYRMPVASDLPMIDTIIVEVANPLHPHGVRGVGETPIVPPLAAVANAVRSATGVRFHSLPMSPPRMLAGIESGEA